MNGSALSNHVTTLYQEVSVNEARKVMATFDAYGYLLVGERCEGDLSLFAFGSLRYYHQIVIAPDTLGQLQDAFHFPDGKEDCEGILKSLRRYFQTCGAFLSELMDVLDAKGVPYGYLSNAETKLVSYRPARRMDGSSY